MSLQVYKRSSLKDKIEARVGEEKEAAIKHEKKVKKLGKAPKAKASKGRSK